jgi:hypothetical protein
MHKPLIWGQAVSGEMITRERTIMFSKSGLEQMASAAAPHRKQPQGKPVDRKPSKVGYAIGSTFLALFVGWAATWLLDRFLFYTFLHRGIVPLIPSTIDELLGTGPSLFGGINPIKTAYMIIFVIVFVCVMRWRGLCVPKT